jgi:uncharacterized membrane protein YdjX (TVP38/TMEM64 family)
MMLTLCPLDQFRVAGALNFFEERFVRTERQDGGQQTMRRVAITNRKKLWPKLLLAALAIGVIVLGFTELIDWPRVREWMQHLDRRLLLALMAVLPLFGFSISLVYLVIGAVFGGPWGVLVVAGITAIHLLGSHWLGHGYLRGPLQRWLEKRKHTLPEVPNGEDIPVALMMALVPGPPYFIRNYLLSVSGIPLRIYFWVCWPVYVVRSCLALFLADFSDDLSPKRIAILVGVFAVKIGICAIILRRLRARSKRAKAVKKVGRTPLQERLARIGRLD